MRVIKPKIMPTVPKTIPGLSEFHSGSSAMHIPSANITPDIVVRSTLDFEKSLILGAFQGFWLIPTRQSFSNTKQICLVFYGNIQIFSFKSPYSFALFNFLVSK